MVNRRFSLFNTQGGAGGAIEYRRDHMHKKAKKNKKGRGQKRQNPKAPQNYRIVVPAELAWEAMMKEFK